MPGMRPLLAGLAAAGGLLCAAVGQAAAGYAIVDQQGMELLVSRGRIKHVARSAEAPVAVFDLARGRLWFASSKTRSYWEGTADEFCTAMKQTMDAAMSEMEKQMKEQLATLPPDQRAQMEQMMKQMLQGRAGQPAAAQDAPPPRVTVERTGEQATIAGLSARRFRVLSDGQPFQDVWLASDSALLEELQLAKASNAYGRMSACRMGPRSGPGASAAAVAESQEYLKLYGEGWPVRVVSHGSGAPQTVSEIVKVERRDVPEAEFAPPAGFRKAPLMEVLGGR